MFTLALLLALVAPSQAQVNVLTNPGFETGSLAPWFQDRDFSVGEDWNVTASDAHSGTFSATDTGNKEIRQNFTPIPTGDITEISFWEKQTGGFISFIDLFYTDGTDLGTTVSPTDSWSQFDVTSILVPGKLLNGFSVFGVTDGSDTPPRTFLDDVRIMVNQPNAVPEPGSVALLTGFLLSAAPFVIRRRSAIR